MDQANTGVSRRRFLNTAIAAAGAAAAMPRAQAAAKYRRYSVMSEPGRKALATYAKGVQAMLNLPATHPQNWFRNAFIHMMDCPHGNWWFYVWHRGYLGYFEQTIRTVTGDDTFAMPYWDWTTLPELPGGAFDGVLTPRSAAFEKYTANLAVFGAFIKPALTDLYKTLTPAQTAQLKIRGMATVDTLWDGVTAFDPSSGVANAGNMAFANHCIARWYTRENPKLDPSTAKDVAPEMVLSGLSAKAFYDPANRANSFNSSKTTSHHAAPDGSTVFSILEGVPHNMVHNAIGGAGPIDPGPYGYMTNNLSPVDPIFFLHHSNMDRLWDVWTRKQQRQDRKYLPEGADWTAYSGEQFLFYIDGHGKPVGPTTAGDFVNMSKFDYDYAPGFGEEAIGPRLLTQSNQTAVRGLLKGGNASMTVAPAAVKAHVESKGPALLFAEITVQRPAAGGRRFNVLVGAPAGVTAATPDSPYYAGTISFFGHEHAHMPGMAMASTSTFVIPLPKTEAALHGGAVNIRVVPADPRAPAPVVQSIVVRSI